MKKSRKSLTALLVSAVMVIGSSLPAAANNYDAASAVSNGTTLFPNDTVAMTWNDASGAYDTLYLMNSYGEAVSEVSDFTEGYWTSPDNGKAYRLDERISAETGEADGYEASELGSVLTVYGGTTRYTDDTLEAQEQQHYQPQGGMDGSFMQMEKSVYPTGSSIMVIADLYSQDGLQELTSWTADGYCSPDELSQIEKHPETNQAVLYFTTKDQAVTLTPNYTDRTDLAPVEEPVEEAMPGEGMPVEGMPDEGMPVGEGYEEGLPDEEAPFYEEGAADPSYEEEPDAEAGGEWAPDYEEVFADVPADGQGQPVVIDTQDPSAQAPAGEDSIFNNLDESALSLMAQDTYSTFDTVPSDAAEAADEQSQVSGDEVPAQEPAPTETQYSLRVMGGLAAVSDGTQTDVISAPAGDEIAVSAVDPDDGSVFRTWTVLTADGTRVAADDELMKLFSDPASTQTTVVIPEGDLTIEAVYEQPVPETEAPQTDAPQTDAPETDAPQTDAPETDAPQTDTPETDAPQTDAPETDAPETDAPETEAPQTDAPQTDAPQTDAPQTEAPQTEEPEIAPATEQSDETAPAPAAAPASYTVTNNSPADVTVAAGNIANPTTIEAGTDVTVTAQDTSTTRKFTGLTVTLDDGTAVSGVSGTTASFKMPEGNITVQASYLPINTVTVTEGSGSGSYAQGDVVTITADVPEIGWEFKSWTIVSGTVQLADALSDTTTFTMGDAAVTVQATYEMIRYTLDVENGNGDGLYVMDTDVSLSANWPASGKEFDKWVLVDSEAELSAPSRFYCTLTMPADDVLVKATYKDGPNPANNAIENIVAGGEYLKGSTITFHVSGAGMGNTNPNPGDYRYKPAGYQIGSVSGGWTDGNYTTSMAINAIGDYTLTVSFTKEVFDGSKWVSDGTTDTKAVTFHVVNALSVQTGDTSPIIPLAIAAVAALAVIILVLVLKRRRR